MSNNDFDDVRFEHLIPAMSEEDFLNLEDSILTKGLLVPISVAVVGEEKAISDGINRYRICKKHGIPIPEEMLKFKPFDSWNDVEDEACEVNVVRRHLETWQKADIAVRWFPKIQQQGKKGSTRKSSKSDEKWDAYKEAARRVGISHTTFLHYKKIVEEAPDQLERIRMKQIGISALHSELFDPPEDDSESNGEDAEVVFEETDDDTEQGESAGTGTSAGAETETKPKPAPRKGKKGGKGKKALSDDKTVPESPADDGGSKENTGPAPDAAGIIMQKFEGAPPELLQEGFMVLDDEKALRRHLQRCGFGGPILPVITDEKNRKMSFIVFRDEVVLDRQYDVSEPNGISSMAYRIIHPE
jgi:hypothetical protein